MNIIFNLYTPVLSSQRIDSFELIILEGCFPHLEREEPFLSLKDEAVFDLQYSSLLYRGRNHYRRRNLSAFKGHEKKMENQVAELSIDWDEVIQDGGILNIDDLFSHVVTYLRELSPNATLASCRIESNKVHYRYAMELVNIRAYVAVN